MQAVILAAGMGRRLGKYTQDNTKCMVKVNGETLISRLIRQITRHNEITKIVVVVGYKGNLLKDYISSLNPDIQIEYVENPDYAKTNNIYSLYLAKDYLCQDDTLLFESDLIFEDSVLDLLINDSRDTLALVDKFQSWMDGTCVELTENNMIKRFVARNKFDFNRVDRYYKTVNIYKFSKYFSEHYYIPFLEAYCQVLGKNEYYEQVLKVIAMLDNPPISALCLSGQKWYEIDDLNDLNIATTLFAEPDVKLKRMESSYGGFWRYNDVKDFCYLVNPYYPTQEVIDEIKSCSDILIRSYPSGQYQNSLLAARNFDIEIDNIAVGNGAAELIKSVMSFLHGKTGFIRPTFEEYPARCDEEKEIVFRPEGFVYSADDIISFFSDKPVSNLILINPDNPSGNFIDADNLIKLCRWTEEKGITFILDESFVDFAEGTIEGNSLLKQQIIEEYWNLIVVKSISKSYGIPGLRLGIIASGNTELIDKIKKDVSIWNINSLAEFYMQIYLKYKKAYIESLERIKEERRRFISELSKISQLEVFPSQANYVMACLASDISSHDLCERLLSDYSILIKDLTKKINDKNGKQYIRVAVKSKEEDDCLLTALKEIFG